MDQKIALLTTNLGSYEFEELLLLGTLQFGEYKVLDSGARAMTGPQRNGPHFGHGRPARSATAANCHDHRPGRLGRRGALPAASVRAITVLPPYSTWNVGPTIWPDLAGDA